MEVKVKLTVGAIVRWEQITGKCFSEMDYSNEDDLKKLLYCTVIIGEKKVFTLQTFENILTTSKIRDEAIRALEDENDMLSQFQRHAEIGPHTEDEAHTPVSDLAGVLIMDGGLDAGYVMNEMMLCDLPLYIKAYEKKKREGMEASRLWTFFQILPHIDGKKFKSPKDLYVFPWEEEEEIRRIQKETEDNEENLKKLISGELFDINSINWKKREE